MREIREEIVPEYKIIKIEKIEELNTIGFLLKHKKTGANIVCMVNDDDNKVFNIGFRTPPEDNTGLPHILEHSVLCGSKKFPAKDPFVELVQGSLNTFLNAMTYPDKTIYPVASCNDKDFKNLMDVYLDSVFNTNIYEKEEIFKQEGWHYHLEKKEDKLTYNGVVYNEMKGAFSTPESVLDRSVKQELFPDTCYGNESGGNPENIPELTYKEFLDFHRRYYHPSNSYIYLYGKMDMVERLEFLDKEYLSKYDMLKIDSEVKMQKPFDKVKVVENVYPIGNDEDEEDKGFLSYAAVTGIGLDRELYYAFKVLDYALLSMPGAPLKQALIDAGIGKAITGGYNESFIQNQFSIIAKSVDTSKRDTFVSVIESTLKDIIKNGIDKKSLKAGLNVMEFQYREADFGNFPKGLFYCLYMFDSWLYDETEPFIHIKAAKTFEDLNIKAETGYFEELIEKYILNNTHKVIYSLNPKKGLTEEKDRLLEEKLEAYKNSLSDEELEKIISDTLSLDKYQSEPSSKEDLEKIPVISLSDIEKKPKLFKFEERQLNDTKAIFTDVFSNGISYIKASFNCKYVPKRLIPYIGFLENILGNMDTEKFKYSDLNNEINMHSGGVSTSAAIYNKNNDFGEYDIRFDVSIKVFYKEMPFAFKILEEILLHTKVENEKRLKEIISENLTKLRSMIISSGHVVALYRGMSYVNEAGVINDQLTGIGAYEFFHHLEKNFNYDEIINNIKTVIKLIFNKDNLIIGLTADNEGFNLMEKNLHFLADSLHTAKLTEDSTKIFVVAKNEGIKIPSPVSYVARVGNFKKSGYKYIGTLLSLKNVLDYGYLWQNVRVKGGAYGVMSSYAANSGNIGYISYRDPNLAKTNNTFESIPDYLKNFEADDREMLKYIIGSISGLDTPLNPRAEGNRSFAAYICNKTNDDIISEREEILNLTVEKVRETGKIIEAVINQGYICVVGNSDKINESASLFHEVKEIFE